MDLIRLAKNDLTDLRNLLLYLKENGMQIDDLNNMIYHLSKKYEFDPFKYEINLLTGIISERKNQNNPYEQIRIEKQAKLKQTKESSNKPIPEKIEKPTKPKTRGEKVQNRGTLYRLNQKNEKPTITPDINEHLKDFRRWINQNQFDLITVRKMVSMVEQYKRHEELTPDEYYKKPEEIIELQEWIEDRNLDYLKLRMMLAIIDQQEVNLKREMVIAR
jgi:hypothetical protein